MTEQKEKRYAELIAKRKTNPLTGLSIHALMFLVERTDFREPWLVVGFATEMEDALKQTLEDKKEMESLFTEKIKEQVIQEDNHGKPSEK